MKFTTDQNLIKRLEEYASSPIREYPEYRYSVVRHSDGAQRFQPTKPRFKRKGYNYFAWDHFESRDVPLDQVR